MCQKLKVFDHGKNVSRKKTEEQIGAKPSGEITEAKRNRFAEVRQVIPNGWKIAESGGRVPINSVTEKSLTSIISTQ